MSALAAVALAIQIILVPRALEFPAVVAWHKNSVVIENPMKYPIVVTLDCGDEWRLEYVRVEARSKLEVIIIGEDWPYCKVPSFGPVTKRRKP